MEVQTVARPVSTCFYEKVQVKSGFSEPKECNCKLNSCIVKVTDVSCLVSNSECRKCRSLFLKSTRKLPKAFITLYEKINDLKLKVQSSFVDIEKSEKEKDFLFREYNLMKYLLRNAEQESTFANSTEVNVRQLLVTDICLLTKYQKESNLSNLFRIKRLTFDGNLPFINNIQMSSEVFDVSTGNIMTIHFVYQFSDPSLSLQSASKKIVNTILCNNARRKRRSVSDNDMLEDEYTFKSWYVDRNLTATSIQLACVTFKRITEYLEHTTKLLSNITLQALKLNGFVNSSTFSFTR